MLLISGVVKEIEATGNGGGAVSNPNAILTLRKTGR